MHAHNADSQMFADLVMLLLQDTELIEYICNENFQRRLGK